MLSSSPRALAQHWRKLLPHKFFHPTIIVHGGDSNGAIYGLESVYFYNSSFPPVSPCFALVFPTRQTESAASSESASCVMEKWPVRESIVKMRIEIQFISLESICAIKRLGYGLVNHFQEPTFEPKKVYRPLLPPFISVTRTAAISLRSVGESDHWKPKPIIIVFVDSIFNASRASKFS